MRFLVKVSIMRTLGLCFNSVGIYTPVAVHYIMWVNVMLKGIRAVGPFMHSFNYMWITVHVAVVLSS